MLPCTPAAASRKPRHATPHAPTLGGAAPPNLPSQLSPRNKDSVWISGPISCQICGTGFAFGGRPTSEGFDFDQAVTSLRSLPPTNIRLLRRLATRNPLITQLSPWNKSYHIRAVSCHQPAESASNCLRRGGLRLSQPLPALCGTSAAYTPVSGSRILRRQWCVSVLARRTSCSSNLPPSC